MMTYRYKKVSIQEFYSHKFVKKMKIKSNKNLPNSVCENSNLTSSLSFSVRALSRRICSFSSSDSSVCIFILKSVISRSCRSFSSLRSFSARSRCSRSCRYRLFSFRRYFLNHLAQKKFEEMVKYYSPTVTHDKIFVYHFFVL